MSAVSLDSAYRPVRRLTVPVATEAVVYDRRNDRLHRLDPIATVVWSGLDGRTSVRSLCAELAEAYSAPVDQVTHDVVALLENLLEQELVTAAGGSGEPGSESDEEDEDSDDDEGEPAAGLRADQQLLHDHGRVLGVRPSLCLDTVTGMGWHATDALVAGDGRFVLGVRTSDAETRARVREAWAGAEWRDDLAADPNVSIRPPVSDGARVELGQVFAECTLVARSRTLEPLLEVAGRELAGRIAMARTDLATCRVSVLRAPDDGGLMLAPASWWTRLVGYDRALADEGWELVARHLVLGGAGTGGVPGGLGAPAALGDPARTPATATPPVIMQKLLPSSGPASSLADADGLLTGADGPPTLQLPVWDPAHGPSLEPYGPVVEVVGPVGDPSSPAERTAAVASVVPSVPVPTAHQPSSRPAP